MIKKMTVQDILVYIEENLEDEISIDDIVQLSGYGRRYIQLIFKQQVKMPIGAYIRRRRITRGAVLLRLTKMPVIEISVKLGFDSQQSFCREFKKVSGCSPLQYRKHADWDLTPMLSDSGLTPIADKDTPDLCMLPDGVVMGHEHPCEISLMKKPSWEVTPWPFVLRAMDKSAAQVWVLNSFSVSEHSRMCLKIFRVIGVPSPESPTDAHCYPYKGGLYAHFVYHCSAGDYSTHSRRFYQEVLPRYGFKRREGYDIEIFHPPEASQHPGQLRCEHYIPVTL